jgi:hypothetical protein
LERSYLVLVTVTGRIVRPDGAPVAGAWINDHTPSGALVSNDPFGTDDGPTRSGPDGRFTLGAGFSSGERQIVAILTGYRPGVSSPIAIVTDDPIDVGDIVLTPAGKGLVRVRIRRADGHAFEGPFRLFASSVALDESRSGVAPSATGNESSGASSPKAAARDEGFERLMAGPGGTAEPVALTAGRYELAAGVPGFTCATVTVEVTDGALADVDLVLTWQGRLVIRVVDDETGEPIPGAIVGIWLRGENGGKYDGRTVESGSEPWDASAMPHPMSKNATHPPHAFTSCLLIVAFARASAWCLVRCGP